MRLELKQLVGIRRGVGGVPEEVKQPTDRVFVDGRQVGFLGRRDNAMFCPIVQLSQEELAPILRLCQEARDKVGIFTGKVLCKSKIPAPDLVRDVMEAGDTQREEYDDEEEDEYEDDEIEN